MVDKETKQRIDERYEHIISQLVLMIDEADKWLIK